MAGGPALGVFRSPGHMEKTLDVHEMKPWLKPERLLDRNIRNQGVLGGATWISSKDSNVQGVLSGVGFRPSTVGRCSFELKFQGVPSTHFDQQDN